MFLVCSLGADLVHLIVDLQPTSRSDLTGRKSIWSYVGHIFINSIFLTFPIFIIYF
jgi:hypothetical protein